MRTYKKTNNKSHTHTHRQVIFVIYPSVARRCSSAATLILSWVLMKMNLGCRCAKSSSKVLMDILIKLNNLSGHFCSSAHMLAKYPEETHCGSNTISRITLWIMSVMRSMLYAMKKRQIALCSHSALSLCFESKWCLVINRVLQCIVVIWVWRMSRGACWWQRRL